MNIEDARRRCNTHIRRQAGLVDDPALPLLSSGPLTCSAETRIPAPAEGTSTPHPPTAASSPTSLEHSETSENPSTVQAFLAAKKDGGVQECILDESSWSARFHHAGWASIRRRIWESLVRTQQAPSRLCSFGSCGSACYVQQSDIDASRFRLSGSRCNDRLCTPCANARSRRIQEALLAQMGGEGCLFITLTLCGRGEALAELIDRLYRHFKALRNHPTWSERIQGGAAFLEVKWSDKAQRWHPHLHIVADGRFVPQDQLSLAWRSISKDSFIVDVRRVRDQEACGRYVAKYASKPLNMSFGNTPRLLDEAVVALKGRRLCLCFGSWYGTPLSYAEDETLADDLVDAAGWHSFFPLEDILRQAAEGDAWSQSVLRSAGVEARWRSSLTAGP